MVLFLIDDPSKTDSAVKITAVWRGFLCCNRFCFFYVEKVSVHAGLQGGRKQNRKILDNGGVFCYNLTKYVRACLKNIHYAVNILRTLQKRELEMKKSIRNRVGIFIAVVLFMTVLPVKAGEHKLEIQFFYNNACASCKEEEKIFDLFNQCLTPEEKSRVTYEIRTYNTFQLEDKKKFDEVCETADEEQAEKGRLPVLIVGSRWIWGYENIEKNLKEAFFSEGEETGRIPDDSGNTSESTGEVSGDSGKISKDQEKQPGNIGEVSGDSGKPSESIGEEAGIPGENSEDQEKQSEDSSEDTKSDVNALIGQLKKKHRDPKQNFVVYFSTYSCSDCEKVKEYLQKSGAGDVFELKEYNIAEENYVMLVQEFFRHYQVPKEKQKVPAVFYGESYLTGAEDICDMFSEELADGKAKFAVFDQFTGTASLQKAANGVTGRDFFTFALSGFLAGFNPCAVSMLLMLLSILLTTDTSVLKSGLLYLAGKYITYFAIGAGIYYAVSWINQGAFEKARAVINLGITVLFLLAAIFYFIDFWNVKKKEYGKIKMQLPAKLRGWNHRLIKRVSAATPVVLLFVVFGLGIAISLGEFFCTGQIYMANILYLMKNAAGNTLRISLLFVLYVTCMCLPSLIFILVISRTKNVNRVSGFMLRHMGAVKLFNAVLFLGFAVYFLLL